MSVRDDIVAALATVPSLAPAASMPAPIVPGQAWPAWAWTVPLTRCGPVSTWYVFVALPPITAATVPAGDQITDDVAVALSAVGKLVRWEPWSIPVEPGQQGVPVVRYTMEV